MVSYTISLKGKPKITVDFPSQESSHVTIKQLKAAVHGKFRTLDPNRQRLTLPKGDAKPVALTDDSKTLASYGVADNAELRLKDLGKQVPYRYLYLWEYRIFHSTSTGHFELLYLKAKTTGWTDLYQPLVPQILSSPLGTLHTFITTNIEVDIDSTVRNVIALHFVKRWLESAFIHKFSRPTLPLLYVCRNSLYYWGVVGVLCGLTLYRPAYSAEALKGSILNNPTWVTFWSLFILGAELLNLNAHWHLSTLRTPPGQPRKFPKGLGFGTVVCANYWFETLAVLGMSIMTGFDFGTVIYSIIATFFMHRWAAGKYARYKREFDPKVFPGRRWKWFPPFS